MGFNRRRLVNFQPIEEDVFRRPNFDRNVFRNASVSVRKLSFDARACLLASAVMSIRKHMPPRRAIQSVKTSNVDNSNTGSKLPFLTECMTDRGLKEDSSGSRGAGGWEEVQKDQL